MCILFPSTTNTALGALARLGYVSMVMMMMVPQQNYFDRGVVTAAIVRGEGKEGGGTSNVFMFGTLSLSAWPILAREEA